MDEMDELFFKPLIKALQRLDFNADVTEVLGSNQTPEGARRWTMFILMLEFRAGDLHRQWGRNPDRLSVSGEILSAR